MLRSYNRAARMVEMMQEDGIVGPADGTKTHEVLVHKNNIGKKLDVVISKRVLVRAVIQAKIESGVISLGEWNLDEAVKKIKEILKIP